MLQCSKSWGIYFSTGKGEFFLKLSLNPSKRKSFGETGKVRLKSKRGKREMDRERVCERLRERERWIERLCVCVWEREMWI